MKITSKEIANVCGVSRGTVDRALNNRPGISEATRQLVTETARKLGYKPNFLARSLCKGKTITIGLVVFDMHNRFFAQMASEIELKARQLGYFVYLTLTNGDSLTEKDCIEHLLERKVDGIILCSVIKEGNDYYKSIDCPIVAIGNSISPEIPFAGIDDYNAMRNASEFLLMRGYERIVYISPPLSYEARINIFAQIQRYSGFVDAIEKWGKKIEYVKVASRNYLDKLDDICLCDSRKTAILCSSDIYALEVLNHMKCKGLDIPVDIGLMGFDNIDTLKYVEPLITTVSYPVRDIAHMAVECLINKIHGFVFVKNQLFKHKIIEGSST